MIPGDSIKVDPMSEVARGHFGDVREGRLEGRAKRMAIKELRPRGDAEARLRVEVVSHVVPDPSSSNVTSSG